MNVILPRDYPGPLVSKFESGIGGCPLCIKLLNDPVGAMHETSDHKS